MAKAALPPEGDLPPSRLALGNPSDQEALELDRVVSSLPPLSIFVTNRHTNVVVRWWRNHVSLGVPHVACRDHLANERTYLAYLRTGQMFAMVGVIVAQVMRIVHNPHPNPVIGFFVVSIPLSAICHGAAICFSACGAARFFRCQREMARGNAVAGGWELKFLGTMTTLILACVFVLCLAITVEKG